MLLARLLPLQAVELREVWGADQLPVRISCLQCPPNPHCRDGKMGCKLLLSSNESKLSVTKRALGFPPQRASAWEAEGRGRTMRAWAGVSFGVGRFVRGSSRAASTEGQQTAAVPVSPVSPVPPHLNLLPAPLGHIRVCQLGSVSPCTFLLCMQGLWHR